ARVRAEVDEVLARRDVLLAPTTPLPAPGLDQTETRIGDAKTDVRSALIRLTRPFNFSGHPACSLPCGVSADGLPIGMHTAGRPPVRRVDGAARRGRAPARPRRASAPTAARLSHDGRSR